MGSRGAKLHELEIEDNRNYIVTGQILDAEVLHGKSKKNTIRFRKYRTSRM